MTEFGSEVLPARYWAKVEVQGECWIWTAAKDRKGYGRVGLGRATEGTIGAHVWMARVTYGPKPDPGMGALHSCDTPACVRPEHLSWGTPKRNSQEMVARGRSTRKLFCIAGHELSVVGRYVRGGCIPCARRRANKRRAA